MWPLLSIRVRTYLIVGLAAVVGVLYSLGNSLVKNGTINPGWVEVGQSTFASVPFVLLAGLLVGRMRWTWSSLCRLGLSNWYPDLNGVWRGPLKSPRLNAEGTQDAVILMRIDQRWSGIKVKTESIEGYSQSVTINTVPRVEDGEAVLWMNFLAHVPEAKETDEKVFYGTSRISFDTVKGTIQGTYWTNRASQQGRNTAGSFKLTRLSENPFENKFIE